MNTKVKVALITGCASIIVAVLGSQYGEKSTISKLSQSIGDITGDNTTITINNVDDIVNNYTTLKEANELYSKQIQNSNKEIENLKQQIKDTPTMTYKDLQLFINGEDSKINSKNSMIIIDGREYLDKSFIDKVLGSKKTFNIKEDKAYIGKVVKNKTNLTERHLVDSSSSELPDSITDSYGNIYTDAIAFYGGGSYATFNLNKEFSLFKCKFSLEDESYSDITGRAIIKADKKVVYTSPILTKKTKPFVKADIPLNNCTLLEIEFHSEGYIRGIISNASVYN